MTNLPWTTQNAKIVRKIHKEVNSNIRYREDKDSYPDLEIPEYWEIIRGKGRGDCDDYALTKRAFLIEAFPEYRNCFRICTCWIQNKEYHAVLIVDTDSGSYVLDNNLPRIELWNTVGYKFHKVQSKDGTGWENLLMQKSQA